MVGLIGIAIGFVMTGAELMDIGGHQALAIACVAIGIVFAIVCGVVAMEALDKRPTQAPPG